MRLQVIFYKTALQSAIEKENIEIIKLLLTNDNIEINIIKTDSSKNGRKRIIKSNIYYYSILNKKNKVVKFLISEIKSIPKLNLNDNFFETTILNEIDAFEKTSLYVAVENKNIEAIQLLLSISEINVNEKSFFFYGNYRTHEKTPLHLAVEKEYIEIIKILLEHKSIDVNVEDEKGKKPIDYTSNNEILKLLNH